MADHTMNPVKRTLGHINSVTSDILHMILSRLPALSFASSACVNKSWNHVCRQILRRPKLASALSLNPSFNAALQEVVDKVLSEPIRPDFVIAFVGVEFSLKTTHQLITKRFGSRIPIITSAVGGIIGRDTRNVLKEVKWELPHDDIPNGHNSSDNRNRGIVLSVGYVPGLKVDVVPLWHSFMDQRPQKDMVDTFLKDITKYSTSVSGNENPLGIILFGGQRVDLKPIIADIDYAFPEETFIVGDATGCFLWQSKDGTSNQFCDQYNCDAIGLVFAKDARNPQGIGGEYKFHVTHSPGIVPFGPYMEVDSVQEICMGLTLLTARTEANDIRIDGEDLVGVMVDEFQDSSPRMYMGVKKYSSVGSNSGDRSYLALYQIIQSRGGRFVVSGNGIVAGESFLLYHSDSGTASTTCMMASDELEILKNSLKQKSGTSNGEIFGGMIFACYARGESFFGRPNIDSFPLRRNFPDCPLIGAYCLGEIGRPSRNREESNEERGTLRSCFHSYNTFYLAMCYIPPSSDHE